jgi:gamma-glutamylcysteine synthetase
MNMTMKKKKKKKKKKEEKEEEEEEEISNFRRVLYVVCFLLGNTPTSEFYMPTFRNTLSVPSSHADRNEG